MTVESALQDAEKRMKGAISVLHEELAGIRTGRATPALLNRITVDYYGSTVPMNQLASFSKPSGVARSSDSCRAALRGAKRALLRDSSVTTGPGIAARSLSRLGSLVIRSASSTTRS